MATVRLFNTEHSTQAERGRDLLEVWMEDSSTTLWVDIEGPLDEAAARVPRARMDLHPLTL